MMASIKILHLYHDILNLYGDYGNVEILRKHIEDQGFKVEVEKKTINDEIELDKYLLIFIGSGTERSLDRALKDIRRNKEQFVKFINSKRVLLATGNSFELFGKKIDNEDALGIFDFETQRDKDRTTSDVIYSSQYLKQDTVGFVNKRRQDLS